MFSILSVYIVRVYCCFERGWMVWGVDVGTGWMDLICSVQRFLVYLQFETARVYYVYSVD